MRFGPSSTSVASVPPTAASTTRWTAATSRPYRAIVCRSIAICNCDAPEKTSTCRSATPRTRASTDSTSEATRSSTALSSPNTFTATSALTPDTTSSSRIAIGCVKFTATPGISPSAAASASINPSLFRPVVHAASGWRFTYTSPW